MIGKNEIKVLKENWHQMNWWKERFYPTLRKRIVLVGLLPYYKLFGYKSCNFMEEDWDNLIILDGCRHDMYEEMCDGDSKLEHRISPGCSTREFLSNTFIECNYHDTVYVTANPQLALRLDTDIFHDVIHVWKTDWDDDLETVRPEAMTEQTIEARKRYPNKRIISHYIQPHYPFIGPYAQNNIDDQSGVGLSKKLADGQNFQMTEIPVWDKLRIGELDEEVVWKAYRENLEITLPHMSELETELPGKTVITSDHGNLVGERFGKLPLRFYGHPTGIRAENLVKVPWHIVNDGERIRVTSDAPRTLDEEIDDNVVNDRLEALGYT